MTGYAMDHPLVQDYLRRIDAATAHLTVDEGTDVRQGIREHLAEALTAAQSDADVRNILDALGQPEEIVDAPAAQPAAWPPHVHPQPSVSGRGAHEIMAVILLLVGGLVVPVVGWIIGVVLLWTSKAWTQRQKLLGTFVLPGGLMGVFVAVPLLAFIPLQTCRSSSGPLQTTSGEYAGVIETCTGFAPAGWMTALTLAISILAPLAVGIYLLRVAGKRTASGNVPPGAGTIYSR